MKGARTLFAVALVLWSGALLRDGLDRWVEETQLPPLLAETSVEARDSAGALLRVFPVEEGRTRLKISLEEVDPLFLRMLIAYEDKRFYRHGGIDAVAGLRAVGQALRAGHFVSGGSTLTMQVARLLENSGTGGWPGKIRQVRLALALERRLSKSDILSLYLLHAPYGGAVEGLRAGTLAWFGKEPSRLSPAEAALLVALPQAPEVRRPDRFPEAARQARDRVLARTLGLPPERQEPLPRRMRALPRLAPHLTDHLRRQFPLRDSLELTIDRDLQSRLEDLAREALLGQPKGLSLAVMVADHRTGELRASIGSPLYSAQDGLLGFVDMTRASRSPGSTLKPLIYGLAFDQGLVHPESIILDAPVSFGGYAPQNFDGTFRGEVKVREALLLSLNIPPVLLTEDLGPARLLSSMRRAGMDPQLPGGAPGLALALGGVGVSLADLLALYAAIANEGQARSIMSHKGEAAHGVRQIMSRSAAWHLGEILSSIPPPPGSGITNGSIAYKTGTSYGHRDAWAIGFDGAHVVAVWMGRPDGTPVPGAFGGSLAAPLLFDVFGRIGSERTPLGPPPPETLMVSTSALPPPLRRFRGRAALFQTRADAPQLLFPPEGAQFGRLQDQQLTLKVRSGQMPFMVMVDGRPVRTDLRERETLLPLQGQGFTTITIVDAQGQADRVQIRLME